MNTADQHLQDDVLDIENVRLGELSQSIGFYLRLAQIEVYDAYYSELGDQGLKPGEFAVLEVIGLNPGLRQGSIARRLKILPAHMTKLVQRLARDGYVRRVIPAHDRRSVRLGLTERGRAFVDENRAALLARHAAERAPLSDEEYQTLLRLLRKLSGGAAPD